jgi:hypothetical protein
MYNRRLSMLASSLLVILGVFCCGSRAHAQAAPQPLPLNLIGAPELSTDQVNQVKAYVSHYADQLNTASEWSEIESARQALISPLNQPNPARMVSPVFRLEYSMAATPAMERAVKSEDLHRMANAMLVLSQLGDDRAATAIHGFLDPAQEPRWQVRDRAADAIKVIFQLGVLDARRVPQVASKVRDVAMRETNGMVLAHLLTALDAAAANAQSPEDAQRLRLYLIEAMTSVASRLSEQNELALPVLDAFTKELGRFRNTYSTLSSAESVALGAMLGPALGKVLAHVARHWDAARADPRTIERVAVLVGACETSLQFVDAPVRKDQPPPWDGSLRSAWNAGNKADFEKGVAAWQAVLSKAPYKP